MRPVVTTRLPPMPMHNGLERSDSSALVNLDGLFDPTDPAGANSQAHLPLAAHRQAHLHPAAVAAAARKEERGAAIVESTSPAVQMPNALPDLAGIHRLQIAGQ